VANHKLTQMELQKGGKKVGCPKKKLPTSNSSPSFLAGKKKGNNTSRERGGEEKNFATISSPWQKEEIRKKKKSLQSLKKKKGGGERKKERKDFKAFFAAMQEEGANINQRVIAAGGGKQKMELSGGAAGLFSPETKGFPGAHAGLSFFPFPVREEKKKSDGERGGTGSFVQLVNEWDDRGGRLTPLLPFPTPNTEKKREAGTRARRNVGSLSVFRTLQQEGGKGNQRLPLFFPLAVKRGKKEKGDVAGKGPLGGKWTGKYRLLFLFSSLFISYFDRNKKEG